MEHPWLPWPRHPQIPGSIWNTAWGRGAAKKVILKPPTCHVWEPRVHDVRTIVEVCSILLLQITESHSEVRSHTIPVDTYVTSSMCQLLSHVSFFLNSLLLFAHCILSGTKGNRASKKSKDEGVIKYSSWRKGLYLGPFCILSINGAQSLADTRNTNIDGVNTHLINICFILLYPGYYVMQFPNTLITTQWGCHSF